MSRQPLKPGQYLAPRKFISSNQRFYDLHIGQYVEEEMPPRRAYAICVALHRSQLSLNEHRRYRAQRVPHSNPQRCRIWRDA